MNVVLLVILAVAFGLGAAFVAAMTARQRRLHEAFALALQKRVGGTVELLGMNHLPRVTREAEGFRTQLEPGNLVPAGQAGTLYWRIWVHDVGAPPFELQAPDLIGIMSAPLGGERIKTGDEDFDRQVMVKSKHAALSGGLFLHAEARAAVMDLIAAGLPVLRTCHVDEHGRLYVEIARDRLDADLAEEAWERVLVFAVTLRRLSDAAREAGSPGPVHSLQPPSGASVAVPAGSGRPGKG